jgi:hypothetical protein
MAMRLSRPWITYDNFTDSCQMSDTLPATIQIPSNVTIPQWAYDTAVTDTGNFNYEQALFRKLPNPSHVVVSNY